MPETEHSLEYPLVPIPLQRFFKPETLSLLMNPKLNLGFPGPWMVEILNRSFAGQSSVYGLEIGCFTGRTSFFLSQWIRGLELWAIDPLTGEGSPELGLNPDTWSEIRAAWESWAQSARPSNPQTITQEPIQIEDFDWTEPTLDFVLIDADHSYEAVLKDLELSFPMVKSGGLVFLDDWSNPSQNWGVEQALKDFTRNKSSSLKSNGQIWVHPDYNLAVVQKI